MTFALLFAAALARPEVAPRPDLVADPARFRTVAQLERLARPPQSEADAPLPGFLGVEVGIDGRVSAVAANSPAVRAGVAVGDVITAVDGQPVGGDAKGRLRGLSAGAAVTLGLTRDGETRTVAAIPEAASRPMVGQAAARAVVGIQSGSPRKDGGVDVTNVTPDSAAAKAGVKAGDVLVKIDDAAIDQETSVRDVLAQKSPGDVVTLALKRAEQELEVRATLDAAVVTPPKPSSWDDRLPSAWKRPTYRLLIVGVEYPDQKHNPKITPADWEESLFSRGTYTKSSATGEKTHGSMADYFHEVSYGKLKVGGKFAGWFEVSKKRMDYSTGNGTSRGEKTKLLGEAMELVTAKLGADELKKYDGVFMLYAGGRVNTTRGGLYWPHRSSFLHVGKRWPYFIVQEGGTRMTDISVFCHEFGHMLGLPDLYARPEVPGMEGVGPWCAMSQQQPRGRPQHFSAWCKEQLNWITPAVVDPRVRQKVVLSPAHTSPGEFVKVLVRADGSEYFLIENRQRQGFDSSLPAAGLLIWRVTPGATTQKVFLEEAHGITTPVGPRLFLNDVPYPSRANRHFTPATVPSSKSALGGGYDVYITDVTRLPDGRVTFAIGYEFQ